MTFNSYMIILDVLEKLVEELKEEEKNIKAVYFNVYDAYIQDETLHKIISKRIQFENIIEEIKAINI